MLQKLLLLSAFFSNLLTGLAQRLVDSSTAKYCWRLCLLSDDALLIALKTTFSQWSQIKFGWISVLLCVCEETWAWHAYCDDNSTFIEKSRQVSDAEACEWRHDATVQRQKALRHQIPWELRRKPCKYQCWDQLEEILINCNCN